MRSERRPHPCAALREEAQGKGAGQAGDASLGETSAGGDPHPVNSDGSPGPLLSAQPRHAGAAARGAELSLSASELPGEEAEIPEQTFLHLLVNRTKRSFCYLCLRLSSLFQARPLLSF